MLDSMKLIVRVHAYLEQSIKKSVWRLQKCDLNFLVIRRSYWWAVMSHDQNMDAESVLYISKTNP